MSEPAKTTVLYADDDATLRYVTKEMLEALGFSVLLAADGAEVLSKWREGVRFDLLLVDLFMPGMSGAEVIKGLQQEGCSAPAVLCTGDQLSDQQAIDMGARAMLAKPYRLRELGAIIRRCLDDGNTSRR